MEGLGRSYLAVPRTLKILASPRFVPHTPAPPFSSPHFVGRRVSVCEVKVILVYGQSWISRGAGCKRDAKGQTCDEQLSQEMMKEDFTRRPRLAGELTLQVGLHALGAQAVPEKSFNSRLDPDIRGVLMWVFCFCSSYFALSLHIQLCSSMETWTHLQNRLPHPTPPRKKASLAPPRVNCWNLRAATRHCKF